LVDQASVILADSTRLLSRAKQKADHIEELKLNLEEQKDVVENVRQTLTEAAKADDDISRQLQKLDNKEGKASHGCHVIEFSLSVRLCCVYNVQLSFSCLVFRILKNLIHICCC
jgi:DNA repair exonuclease SbcCD ATPase subunit